MRPRTPISAALRLPMRRRKPEETSVTDDLRAVPPAPPGPSFTPHPRPRPRALAATGPQPAARSLPYPGPYPDPAQAIAAGWPGTAPAAARRPAPGERLPLFDAALAAHRTGARQPPPPAPPLPAPAPMPVPAGIPPAGEYENDPDAQLLDRVLTGLRKWNPGGPRKRDVLADLVYGAAQWYGAINADICPDCEREAPCPRHAGEGAKAQAYEKLHDRLVTALDEDEAMRIFAGAIAGGTADPGDIPGADMWTGTEGETP